MNYAIFGLLILLTAACAYRGVFGTWVWTMCRLPFVYVGMWCMAIGGLPITIPRQEEETAQEEEVPIVASQGDEPGDHENRWGKQKFALMGLTPLDVKRNVLAEAACQSFDPDLDGIENEIPPRKESFAEFCERRKLERISKAA